jgi:hypothetical protein
MTSRQDALRGLESDVDRMIGRASRHKLDLIVYILTMAKLELASQLEEPDFSPTNESRRANLTQ